jgi:hypothetical protein
MASIPFISLVPDDPDSARVAGMGWMAHRLQLNEERLSAVRQLPPGAAAAPRTDIASHLHMV